MADSNNQLNTLINQITREQAEYTLRLANYYTPYGFDPEPVDFERAKQLLADHKTQLAGTVFAQASPNLQDRVQQVTHEWLEREEGIHALKQAGAEVTLTDEEAYHHAVNRIFGRPLQKSA